VLTEALSEFMSLTRHSTAAAFLDAAQTALEECEATNNLMLGIAARLNVAEKPPERAPYFATVSGDTLRAAALMTPPHRVILAGESQDDEALEAILHDLLDGGWPVPGVVGPAALSKAFAAHWCHHTGCECSEGRGLRIYQLTEVDRVPSATGRLRAATMDDLQTVAGWIDRFNRDIRETIPPENTLVMARRRIEAGDIFLWDDGGPRSMAATARKTRHGATLNLVYTPPEHRGQAYATSCVAALCRRVLNGRWGFCCLFADLANPVSNHIYRKMGFRAVCDFIEFDFHEPDSAAPAPQMGVD
jgi:hypothetical protein